MRRYTSDKMSKIIKSNRRRIELERMPMPIIYIAVCFFISLMSGINKSDSVECSNFIDPSYKKQIKSKIERFCKEKMEKREVRECDSFGKSISSSYFGSYFMRIIDEKNTPKVGQRVFKNCKFVFSEVEIELFAYLLSLGVDVNFSYLGTPCCRDDRCMNEEKEGFAPGHKNFPSAAVLHHTASNSDKSTLLTFAAGVTNFDKHEKGNKNDKVLPKDSSEKSYKELSVAVSSHWLVSNQDKKLYVFLPMNLTSLSCGISQMIVNGKVYENVNPNTLNIEITGYGYDDASIFDNSDLILNGDADICDLRGKFVQIGRTRYRKFTENQEIVVNCILDALKKFFPIMQVTTHQRIAPGRKGDVAPTLNSFMKLEDDLYEKFLDQCVVPFGNHKEYVNFNKLPSSNLPSLAQVAKKIIHLNKMLNELGCCMKEKIVSCEYDNCENDNYENNTREDNESLEDNENQNAMQIIKAIENKEILLNMICCIRACVQDFLPLNWILNILKRECSINKNGEVNLIRNLRIYKYIMIIYDRELKLSQFIDTKDKEFIEFVMNMSFSWLQFILQNKSI